jgi:hypothetical protein
LGFSLSQKQLKGLGKMSLPKWWPYQPINGASYAQGQVKEAWEKENDKYQPGQTKDIFRLTRDGGLSQVGTIKCHLDRHGNKFFEMYDTAKRQALEFGCVGGALWVMTCRHGQVIER